VCVHVCMCVRVCDIYVGAVFQTGEVLMCIRVNGCLCVRERERESVCVQVCVCV